MNSQQRENLLNAIATGKTSKIEEALNHAAQDVCIYTSADEWLFDVYKSVMGRYTMPVHQVAFNAEEQEKLKPLEQTLQSLKNNNNETNNTDRQDH